MKNSIFIFFLFLTFNGLKAQTCTLDCPETLYGTCDISEHPVYTTYNDFLSAGGIIDGTCTVVTSSFQLNSGLSDGGTCPETYTRVYEISDDDGETYQCFQEIVIEDVEHPFLICPISVNANCDISEQPSYVDYNDFINDGGTAFDNCEIQDNSFYLLNEISDNGNCPETITRSYIVSDACGNQSTCQQEIVVNDDIRPTITCPPNKTYAAPIEPPYASFSEFSLAGGSAQDNCGIDFASFYLLNEITDDVNNPSYVIRTYEITDLCQYQKNCDQTINFCNHSSKTLLVSECESYTSPSGKYTWSTSGIYKDTIQNMSMCDSLLTIHLTIEDNVIEEGEDGMPNSLRMNLACASFLEEIRIDESVDTLSLIMPLALQDDITIKGNPANPPVVRLDFANNLLTNAPYGIKIENGKTITIENVILLELNNTNQVKLLLNEGTLKVNQTVRIKKN